MPIEETLLGFDAREMWLATGDMLHPAHTPATFLLRDDVDKVLSADTLIWPSLFTTPVLPSAKQLLPCLESPRWIGANPPFWEDLDALVAAIPAGVSEPGRPYWLIAATWISEWGFESGNVGPYREPTRPSQREPDWPLLGYDVTDGSLLSGLSNCGYDSAERPGLVARWSPHLNAHHLFSDVHQALEFRDVSDRRVPEHAPFFVIALWLIRLCAPAPYVAISL